MLEEFLHKHDIDIALLQEKTHPELNTLRNYNAYINQGTEGRGTDILSYLNQSRANSNQHQTPSLR